MPDFYEVPDDRLHYGEDASQPTIIAADHDAMLAARTIATLMKPTCDPDAIVRTIAELDYGKALTDMAFAVAYYFSQYGDNCQDYIVPFLKSIEDKALQITPTYPHFPPFHPQLKAQGKHLANPPTVILGSLNVIKNVGMGLTAIFDVKPEDIGFVALATDAMDWSTQIETLQKGAIEPDQAQMANELMSEIKEYALAVSRLTVSAASVSLFSSAGAFVGAMLHKNMSRANEAWVINWAFDVEDVFAKAEWQHKAMIDIQKASGVPFQSHAFYVSLMQDHLTEQKVAPLPEFLAGRVMASALYFVSVGAIEAGALAPHFKKIDDKIAEILKGA